MKNLVRQEAAFGGIFTLCRPMSWSGDGLALVEFHLSVTILSCTAELLLRTIGVSNENVKSERRAPRSNIVNTELIWLLSKKGAIRTATALFRRRRSPLSRCREQSNDIVSPSCEKETREWIVYEKKRRSGRQLEGPGPATGRRCGGVQTGALAHKFSQAHICLARCLACLQPSGR